MTLFFRILLLIVAVLTAVWILRKIRKCKVRQEDALFWICFAGILIVLGVFPEIAYWAAGALGIQSPANFIFLVIIFLLIEKMLSLSIQVSMLETKLGNMAAELALRTDDLNKRLPKTETQNDYGEKSNGEISGK